MTGLETTSKGSPASAIDPVCEMTVEPGSTKLVSVHDDSSYWFCTEGCRHAFEDNPKKYLKSIPAKKKGWFGRWLDKMAKSNEKEFGTKGPGCCN